MRPAYDRLDGADGFASIEVSPHLAYSTQASIQEARRLWAAVDRPNLMVKIPGTDEGVPAVRALTAEGINVNITLLFAIDLYRAVAEAYLAGLEDRVARGEDVSRVSSVASFFVSRIDTQIDKRSTPRAEATPTPRHSRVRGKSRSPTPSLRITIISISLKATWKALAPRRSASAAALGIHRHQGSAYSDVLYVETLIGPDTINTMPLKTIEAFRDHGRTTFRSQRMWVAPERFWTKPAGWDSTLPASPTR